MSSRHCDGQMVIKHNELASELLRPLFLKACIFVVFLGVLSSKLLALGLWYHRYRSSLKGAASSFSGTSGSGARSAVLGNLGFLASSTPGFLVAPTPGIAENIPIQ